MVLQHKKPLTGDDFTDKLVQQAWSGFDENYMPPDGVIDPIEIAMDVAEKKNLIRQNILQRFGGGQAPNLAQPSVPIQKQVAPIPADASFEKKPKIIIGTPIQIPQ